MTKALEEQVGGDHYKGMKIQVVEFCHKNQIPFMEGAVIKYVCRLKNKGGIKDLMKAKHFLEMMSEMEEQKDLTEEIEECKDLLRSSYSIAERNGTDTNWEAFRNKIKELLTGRELFVVTPPEVFSEAHEILKDKVPFSYPSCTKQSNIICDVPEGERDCLVCYHGRKK